ncbi:MAG: STAS domain-containing protein [Paracoccaceae bacterium]
MHLSSRTIGKALVINVEAPRIDAPSAIQFKDQMRDLTGSGVARVVLDLEQVGFVDSSGLGAIVASMKQLATGQVMELASLSPVVEKVFRLTRMDTIFTIHPNVAAISDDKSAS